MRTAALVVTLLAGGGHLGYAPVHHAAAPVKCAKPGPPCARPQQHPYTLGTPTLRTHRDQPQRPQEVQHDYHRTAPR